MRGLKDKTAIVTGGATLIGAAVVRAFAEAGTRVAVADIDEKGAAVAAGLGERALFVKTDITDDAQIERCVAEAARRFGGVDYLVNLACVYIDDGIGSGREDWLASYNVNVASGVMMLKAVRPE